MGSAATILRNALNQISPRLKEAAESYTLPSAFEGSVREASIADGKASLRSACLTIADALGALDRRAFSWACVKLYYASYYAVRAWLACSDEIQMYLDRSPAYILIRAGEKFRFGKGSSHEFAFNRFSTRFRSLAILSQDVAADPPFVWLRIQREVVQYRDAGFSDPDTHYLFAHWCTRNARQLLDFYLTVDETSTEYSELFDPDQAMIALPLRLLADTIANVRMTHTFSLSRIQLAHCQSLCRVAGHPVASFNRIIC